MEKKTVCCVIGHRNIDEYFLNKEKIKNIVINFIKEKGISVFLFGDNSKFNDFMFEILKDVKNDYKHIKLIYVRATLPYIKEREYNLLKEFYDDTYYPKSVEGSGKNCFVKRNFHMIDKSDICLFFYDANYEVTGRYMNTSVSKRINKNSGTKIAYEYALKKRKEIVNLFSN